jgi:hypothetical protein
MRKEAIMKYLKYFSVLYQHFAAGAEENHDKTQPRVEMKSRSYQN